MAGAHFSVEGDESQHSEVVDELDMINCPTVASREGAEAAGVREPLPMETHAHGACSLVTAAFVKGLSLSMTLPLGSSTALSL